MVPPVVPVPTPVLATRPSNCQAAVGSSLLKPMVAPLSTERLAQPVGLERKPAWLPMRVPAWTLMVPMRFSVPRRARLKVPDPSFSMVAPPTMLPR